VEQSKRTAAVGGEYIRAPDFEGVIFLEGHGWLASDELFPCWTPSREVVAEAERRLTRFLSSPPPEGAEEWLRRTHLYAAPLILGRLPQYRRQYSGIVFEGRPAVYINCFLGNYWDDHWLTTPVVAEDGGHNYFQAIYRPEEGDFVRFYVNGVG
jgi:hypothetical protein